ncbi:MAG: hypothetical protein J0L86_11195 [Flavobacteriales bacterium]|nr:hypothetical protein [Flavobacteriales bacterium]
MGKYKYNLENLEWQQFEKLSFYCLQFDVSKSIQFLSGGNDKGREIVFNGVTDFFGKSSSELSYVFQSKHKSNSNFSSLNSDLKAELNKVFITNNLSYNTYCLVTNISLNGNQYDSLNETFEKFTKENNLDFNLNFKIYSYEQFESCIDRNTSLKFLFPSIIKNTDFQHLLEITFDRQGLNISNSFFSIFKKNRSKFVLTEIFEKAIKKLDDNNILLLSGPPKSGKTFNAEMIVFKKILTEDFIPYNIITIEDFDKFYDNTKKQIFLFDDTFGKYNIDYERSDYINRKIEFIFEFIDENHKCIFTSREYIYRAFLEYADSEKKKFINKINVEVNLLSNFEKESIFLRYYKINNGDVYFNESTLNSIVNHKNFSPEVIRSYFENNTNFNNVNFQNHLDFPDDYLKKIFSTLNDEKKLILLSILLSSNQKINSIAYTYNEISNDLNLKKLIDLKTELNILEDSLITYREDRYYFYHPTMFEFFINYINNDILTYRNLLFNNINTDLLLYCKFKKGKENNIKIDFSDCDNLLIGFKRLLNNPNVETSDINSILRWLKDEDRLINFQLKELKKHKEFVSKLNDYISEINLKAITIENVYNLGLLFKNIRNLSHFSTTNKINFIEEDLIYLIAKYNKEDKFWFLIFNILPFLSKKTILDDKLIGRNWLNNFYIELKKELMSLGKELYGEAFPEFEEVVKYEKLVEEKKIEEAILIKKSKSDYKQNTNKNWFKRYNVCKEKMMIIKSNQPYGNIIYEKLINLYSPLVLLEENQRNRYIFLKQKKWW